MVGGSADGVVTEAQGERITVCAERNINYAGDGIRPGACCSKFKGSSRVGGAPSMDRLDPRQEGGEAKVRSVV